MARDAHLSPHRKDADSVTSGKQPSRRHGPHRRPNRHRQDSNTVGTVVSFARDHGGIGAESSNVIRPRQASHAKYPQPQQTEYPSPQQAKYPSPQQTKNPLPHDINSTSAQRVDSASPAQNHGTEADAATEAQPGQKTTSNCQQANGTSTVKTNVRYSSQDARNTIGQPDAAYPLPTTRNKGGPKQGGAKGRPSRKKQTVEKKQVHEKASPWIKDRDLKGDHLLPDGWFNQDQPELNAGKVDNLFWAWEGEHMPPPIWDERPGFRDSDKDGTVDSWLDKTIVEKNLLGSAVAPLPSTTNFSFAVQHPLAPNGRLYFAPAQRDALVGHIVPRSWIPDVLEPGQSLQNFWEQNINQEPKPVDEEDTADHKPFWEMFVSPDAAVQLPPQYPEHNGCDSSGHNPEEMQKLSKEKGSQGWIDQYLAHPGRFMRFHFGVKSTHKRDRSPSPDPAPAAPCPHLSVVDDTINPSINLFLRSARLSDAPQMTNIYNHYVTNTVCTPEYKEITAADMAGRFNSARANDFPFIVACVRGVPKSPGKRRHREREHRAPGADTVIGFASADDYHNQRNSMRFTAEICVFASPTHKRTGISKCLMDKMMQLLDTYYVPRGSFDIFDKELGLGNVRVISRMVINLLYCPEDGEMEWITTHLADFGFEQAGHLDGVGYKLEKIVDLAVFYRKTGVEINVKRPPLVLL